MSETTAHTEVPGGPAPEEPTALFLNAGQWISVAMLLVFLIALWAKVPAIVARMLDGRISAIRDQLANAQRLRKEAEALVAEYQAKLAAADTEAAALLENARDEAKGLVEKAKADTAALIERRGKIAEDKIAAAERSAIAEVRAKAADAAARAAGAIIAESHGAASDKPLVDKTIAGLARIN